MEEFAQTSTIHGLPHVVGKQKMRRALWIGICTGIYCYLTFSVGNIFQDFFNPKNLKTVVNIDGITIHKNGTFEYPKHYPVLVACVRKDDLKPNLDVSEFQKIKVLQPTEGLNTKKWVPLPPMRLVYMDDVENGQQDLHAFNSLRICSVLPKKASYNSFKFNGVNTKLELRIAFGEERLIKALDKKGNLGFLSSFTFDSKDFLVASIELIGLKILEMYTGTGADYQASYPTGLKHYQKFYRKRHCYDIVFLNWLQEMNDTVCYERYKAVLEMIDGTRGNFSSIERSGCKWSDGYIDCNCQPHLQKNWFIKKTNKTDELVASCKDGPLLVEFETTYKKLTGKEIHMENNGVALRFGRGYKDRFLSVRMTQFHVMTWVDVLAQIGGFFGLLIGASVISFFELLEFTLKLFYQSLCLPCCRYGNIGYC